MTLNAGAFGANRSPRRPRPLLLGLCAVALLTVLLAWMRYDPIDGGDVTWCPPQATMVPTGEVDPDTGEAGVACTVVNTDADAVSFAATVRNSGIFPVVVREVRMRGDIQGVLRVDEVRMAVRAGARETSSRELVPFAPFRLGPGEQRIVEVAGVLTGCHEVSRARVATFRSLPLRTSVFGLPHDSSAGLSPPVQLIAEAC